MNENPRVIPKKATEESVNELHYLVTEDFLRRIRSGEATVQDLKAACDWLKPMTSQVSLTRVVPWTNSTRSYLL